MKRITLKRTGDRPLSFEGEKIAEITSHYLADEKSSRWHALELYRTTKGQMVLSVVYRTLWQGELDHHFACICDKVDDIMDALHSYDPNAYVVGFPGYTEALKVKEERRAQDLQLRYDTAVSDLLASLPEEL